MALRTLNKAATISRSLTRNPPGGPPHAEVASGLVDAAGNLVGYVKNGTLILDGPLTLTPGNGAALLAILVSGLGTTDPFVAGEPYLNAGVLMVSTGA
jgi:hypothetical protein